jgi:hypothetical protein
MTIFPNICVYLRASADNLLKIALIAIATLAIFAGSASAQIEQSDSAESNPLFGEPVTTRFQIGTEVTATRGAVRDIVAMVAVPFECPEQKVQRLEEDFSSQIDAVEYRTLQGGVTQMLVTIPWLADGQTARAVVTFEVTTHPVLPPQKTDDLVIPKRPDNKLRRFLGGSPYIEAKHRTIRSLARDIAAKVDESATDWERVEAIYDYVMDNIKYVEGDDKTAMETLRDEFADCEGRSALFIALCRASKVPARMVWAQAHAYPEFYLEDAEGNGLWYPCESAGTRAFGEMPLARVVLQKGDNFRVPERPNDRLRYATDFLIGTPASNNSKRPRVVYIREPLGSGG